MFGAPLKEISLTGFFCDLTPAPLFEKKRGVGTRGIGLMGWGYEKFLLEGCGGGGETKEVEAGG